MAAVSTLSRTQGLLERLYDVRMAYPVEQYLLSSEPLAAALGFNAPSSAAPSPGLPMATPEALLCRSHENGSVEAALYISSDVLAHVDRRRPLAALTEDVLPDFFTLLEGVSHFVNVAWACERQRAISAFDLELQAELDKFAVAVWLWHRQGRTSAQRHRWLFAALFERFAIDDDMPAALASRYRDANRAAARIVHTWLARGVDRDPKRIVQAVRHWCRQGRQRKLCA